MRRFDEFTGAILPPFSALAEHASDIFYQSVRNDSKSRAALLLDKLNASNFRILLIAGDPPIPEKIAFYGEDIQNLINLTSAWQTILATDLEDAEKHKQAWSVIDELSERLPGHIRHSRSLLRRFKNSNQSNVYFVLFTENDPEILPFYELNNLCNNWQIERGLIPIHSAGLVHRGKLLLFGGISGAGKSTLANLSSEQGEWVLDEDQLLLKPQEEGLWQAQAWGYSLRTNDAPITAVFKLVKDTDDRLISLSSLQTAHFLMDRVLDVMGLALEKKHLEQIFHRMAELARQIPGYELHFRKSPDFWRLIDAELHD